MEDKDQKNDRKEDGKVNINNPVLGIAEAIRKIAIKAREEYGHGG